MCEYTRRNGIIKRRYVVQGEIGLLGAQDERSDYLLQINNQLV